MENSVSIYIGIAVEVVWLAQNIRHGSRRVERGWGNGDNCLPNSESNTNNFQVNQHFDVLVKEMRQCKSTKLLKILFYFSF